MNFGDPAIQVSNIKEAKDATRNQIGGIPKTLIAAMNTSSSETVANSHETI